MDKTDILNFLKENKEQLESKYHIKKIALFGSYAKNTQNQNSDIDILVDMPPSFDAYYELKEFLEKSFQKKVDLGLFHNVREHLKSTIYKEVEYV
ncbi:nucleotidyltransferase family protein [Hydrogenimonas thermophila]|uniref:Polymerase nucleotidyl transferase domain-containing protein n=1 Tax=Hydrogenimonas thermophila TaxID=223786 RepID=A0A1I5MB14_9BACT|nr:nucleotidyltransferase domain-containing protein [Hydrogenimonas thermophila]WOE70629.1 nucleotidyltransferase domain-containing protein [Hydrogenimonas thermophila]WOE73147.1 nucleotidyltransferase domain-containing protein [Hydrogenimonas thermophila]SFP06700.1 hypothetical protein SAMN05216234_10592 [Hydrogenimonas thermophila]